MDARELYRLPPEAFTAARDAETARRRDDGDRDGARAVKALRRPSVAAWLVDLLAQDRADLLGELLELGPALAQAQSGGDAASLRVLGAQRRQLVEAVTATAVQAAGRPVTAAVRDEVAATLEAALADPASAQAVRSGRLVRALSYAGFGDVDLSDAVAADAAGDRPASGAGGAGKASGARAARRSGRAARRGDGTRAAEAARARQQEHARRVAEAEAAAHDAAGRLDDAVRACEQAERVRAAARTAADERAAEVDRLVEELDRVRADHDRAARETDEAGFFADSAVVQVRRAQDAAEAAREQLDRLRRD